MYRHILIPTDGSELAAGRCAMDWRLPNQWEQKSPHSRWNRRSTFTQFAASAAPRGRMPWWSIDHIGPGTS
jgi:hypothetical protein